MNPSIFIRALGYLAQTGVVLWFLVTLVLPIYGILRPWPAAEAALQQSGFQGLPIMIGGASDSERVGDRWSESRQRTYIIVPDSFRRMELVHYTVTKSSEAPEGGKIERSRLLVVFLALWILAGVFSFHLKLKKKNEPNK